MLSGKTSVSLLDKAKSFGGKFPIPDPNRSPSAGRSKQDPSLGFPMHWLSAFREGSRKIAWAGSITAMWATLEERGSY